MANREATFDKLKEDPSWIYKIAKDQGTSPGEALQAECAEKTETWQHPVVTKDFLARSGKRLRSEGRKGASPLGDFKEDWERVLLLDECEHIYQGAWGSKSSKRFYTFANPADHYEANQLAAQEPALPGLSQEVMDTLAASGTAQGFAPGTIQRPYQDATELETPPFEAEVPYADLATVQTISVLDWRVGRFTVSDGDLLMQHVPVGSPAPTIRLAEEQVTAEVYRQSLGIEFGDDIMNSTIPSLTEGLQRMVEDIGSRQADGFSKVIANQLVAAAPTTAVNVGVISAEDLLEMQTSLEFGQVNRVIGQRTPILKYYVSTRAQGMPTGSGASAVRPAVAGTELGITQTRLGNRSQGAEVAYFFRSGTTAAANHVYPYDIRRSVGILEYLQGEMDASKFDPQTAMHARFFARSQGYWTKHNPQVASFQVA